MLAAQIALAFEHLQTVPGRSKLLVFCNTIKGAETLCAQVAELFQLIGGATSKVPLLVASSRTAPGTLRAMLTEFSEPDKPGILFNCKLFQEGVEFPPLNGVFFATPRHSSRDIIQSMCRALTQWTRTVYDDQGKPQDVAKPKSVIYIPVAADQPVASNCVGETFVPGQKGSAYHTLGRFETLLPFAEAIYSEDSRLYEHLLDPSKPYPLGWIGAFGSAETLLQAARRAIRYGTKSSGGKQVDRLTKNDQIPWDVAYTELKRIVEICGRYPKGNDGFMFSEAREIRSDGSTGEPKVLDFGSWYNWVRREYTRFVGGEASLLQPHHVRDLEALRDWKTRGVEGPYPPQECIDTLERMLGESGGVMPPVNVSNGGWIGLDATPAERLSGFLTTISQQDGKARANSTTAHGSKTRGFSIAADKASQLDRIFGKWGLPWRKDRRYTAEDLQRAIAGGKAATQEEAARYLWAQGQQGHLVTTYSNTGKPGEYCGRKTAIQEAYDRFKELAKTDPQGEYIQTHWPGYPEKHDHMELAEVWEKGLAPPRLATRTKTLIARAPKNG